MNILGRIRKVGLIAIPVLAAGIWYGCQKTEQKEATEALTNAQVGDVKLNGDPFIRLNGTPLVQEFRICNTGQQLKTDAAGKVYYTSCTSCPATAVAVKNGYGGVYCFTKGVQYRIRQLTGYLNREMLYATFPTTYNACTLNPATRFDYTFSLVTGTWALGTAANGVIWNHNIAECAP